MTIEVAKVKLDSGDWYRAHQLTWERGGFTCEEAWRLASASDTVRRPSKRRWFPGTGVEAVYVIETVDSDE